MMNAIIAAAILALLAGATNDGDFTESVDVYLCDFEHHEPNAKLESDINYDGWPDGWTRRVARGYPRYLKIGIEPDSSDKENHCLTMRLNGGAAEAFSPNAAVSSLFSYRLQGRMKLEGLKHDKAFISITLFDAQGKAIESTFSPSMTATDGWHDITLGPITPTNPDIRFARIGVHLRPGEKMDIWGSASFDDFKLVRLPRMRLSANHPFHYFEDPESIKIQCDISGMNKSSPVVDFVMEDVYGNVVERKTFPLKLVELRHVTRLRSDDKPVGRRRRKKPGDELDAAEDVRRGYEATQEWRPNLSKEELGFYTIRASIRDGERLVLERSIAIAVARPFPRRREGAFGWSIGRNSDALTLRELAQLTEVAGIHWVKLPIWFGEEGASRADEIAWFAERLSATQVNFVGVLDKPPVAFNTGTEAVEHPPVALVFDQEDVWKPLINPVMTRLSLKMRWWQLGADDDTSYLGFSDLNERIDKIKAYLERFGQEVRLGFSWPWLYELPADEQAPWQFISLSSEVPLTPNELGTALKSSPSTTQRWTLITPLPPERYSVDVRARDLVRRMLEAKINNAHAIFATPTFNDRVGLMRADGTPNSMFLPWRTTTQLTAGSEYVGSVQMPKSSNNYVFAHQDEAIMVVWNDKEVDEVIYLGENIKVIDVWGRMHQPEEVISNGFRRQVIRVGKSPLFLTGVNLPIARWRMAFHFNRKRLESSANQAQRVKYAMKNQFGRSVSGRIEMQTPELWEVTPPETRFDMNDDELRSFPMDVKLGTYAPSGAQPLRIDFRLTADRLYRFSVYREIDVGLGDIQMFVETELDPATGNLIVYVHLDNKTDERMRFECLMFVKDRRRKRLRISSGGRGRTTNTFIAENGKSLIGETIFIQAREKSGLRTLNYRIVAEE